MRGAAIVTIVLSCLGVAVVAGFWLRGKDRQPRPYDPTDLPAPCRETTFEQVDYAICEIDLRTFDVGIFHAGAGGKAYGSLQAFERTMMANGTPVILSMNAGMYHEGLGPVGLLIEDGRQLSPAEESDGEGNFFLKPNGIFLVDGDGGAAVMETGAFLANRPITRYATQSGPMLVIDGKIHPRFLPDGTSRYTRNGVGVRDANTVVLAISLSGVSLGSFARLFRDELDCPNALFLDGDISTLSNGKKTLLGGKGPVGPILAVSEKPANP